MPRIVTKTAHRPYKIGDIKICMCGLSKNQPFCDDSHHKTDNEDDKFMYAYDENGKQQKIGKMEHDEVKHECDCEDCGDKDCGECCGDKCCDDAECKDEKCCNDKDCKDKDCDDCSCEHDHDLDKHVHNHHDHSGK